MPSAFTGEPHSPRAALSRAMWLSLVALAAAAGLMVAVDRGATLLGPVLLVVGGWAGTRTLRTWWRHLNEEWFLAELVLVTASWALFGTAFAALQYLVLSFAPSAFHVDVDYARAAAPRYRVHWLRDSVRIGRVVADYDRAAVLVAGGPEVWSTDSVTPLLGGERIALRASCEELVVDRECTWRLDLTRGVGADWQSIPVTAPIAADKRVTRAALGRAIEATAAEHRMALADVTAKLANAAGSIQPRIGDLFYETAIAFSGRDSGIFAPVGAAARLFKMLESLASYLLFGIVVSRVAAAGMAARRTTSQ